MDNSTPKRQKRGRKPLSPNSVDRELAREAKKQHQAKRCPDGSRGRTEWIKREADRLRQGRRKYLRRLGLPARLGKTVRWRAKAVRYYEHWRQHGTEAAAVSRCATKYGVSVATIRRWACLYRKGGLTALLPKRPGPRDSDQQISLSTRYLVVALRRLYGWNEKRIAAELKQRGLAQISHTSVGRIFKRYYLATRTYHTLAKCDGIPKQRYEKSRINQQWHMDFAETTLMDGTRLTFVVLLDDHSRFCLYCQLIPDMSQQTAITVMEQALKTFGPPEELITDNGRAFMSVYINIPTAFGIFLKHRNIRHLHTSPYYPEGNGKAEAFVKIVKHECLRQRFATRDQVENALAAFVTYYNFYRLHGSLAFQTPASRYCACKTPINHGLFGIPTLPQALRQAYPPAPDYSDLVTDWPTIKRRLALVPITS